ncbi:MAG: hypothetical protein LBU53_07440 [Zoogloeaceae bacterium]|jgi:hypothetical protein|nr:hypothetical protein [Zoogloeaceae bacterium]
MPGNPCGLSVFIPGNHAVLKFAEQPEAMKITLAEVLQGKDGKDGEGLEDFDLDLLALYEAAKL